MEAIKTVDLTKRYKDVITVDRLNLQIERGELFSLLGVNGTANEKTVIVPILLPNRQNML